MKSIADKDKRVHDIITQLGRYVSGNYAHFLPVSERIDETDAIIAGLNQLGDQLRIKEEEHYQHETRLNELLEILMKFTARDFTIRAPISEKGDEIDALSAGMNSLAEELRELQKKLKSRRG
jgi:chromosome segregation ATPase